MNAIIVLIFILLFLLLLFNVASSTRSEVKPPVRNRQVRRPASSQRSARSSRDQASVSETASRAMWRARYEADSSYLQVSDVGLLAYRHMDEPKVRYGDIMMDTRYLRPFAEVWLPYDASGSLRFEIIDSQGRRRYADEARYQLKRGKNTLLPRTWLPLEGKAIAPGDWMMRVLAEDTLLADHVFSWQAVGGGTIQQYIQGDGEISPVLQAMLRSKSVEAVSLSELLDTQDE
jgi:hypothetical protein